MSLGTNILFFRKNLGLTQEEFADQILVSRQTISKWESDGCYPEMEKLMQMTEIFGCSLDTLVKGDAEKSVASDSCGYDTHSNGFIKKICAGMVITMLGICIMLVIYGFTGLEELGGIVFFCCLIPAVASFVLAGIQNNDFHTKNPKIPYFYSEKEIEAFNKKFPILIITGISAVLFGIVVLTAISAVFSEEVFDSSEKIQAVSMAIFLLFVTFGGTICAYAGMMKNKYDIAAYNKEHSKNQTKADKISGAVSGSIMILATIYFIVTTFVSKDVDAIKEVARYNWLSFVVGGLLCGITSSIIHAVIEENPHDNGEDK